MGMTSPKVHAHAKPHHRAPAPTAQQVAKSKAEVAALKAQVSTAMKDKTLTVDEAKALVATAKQGGLSKAEKSVLQSLTNSWADRFIPGAESAFKGLGLHNGLSSFRKGLTAALSDGKISGKEVAALARGLQKNTTTDAERREMVRDFAFVSDKFVGSASKELQKARLHRNHGQSVVDLLNQALPTGPGEAGNRVGDGTGREARIPLHRNEVVGGKQTNQTFLYDGNGLPRGPVLSDSTMVNFGMRKKIGGENYVYAFAVGFDAGTEHAGSGWVKESQLAAPLKMPTVNTPASPYGDSSKKYKLVGAPGDLYGHLKVGKGVLTRENVAASDYLTRAGGVVNMLFSLPGHGGVSNDTFAVGPKAAELAAAARANGVAVKDHALTFIPAKGVPTVKIPLYVPKDATDADRAMLARHPTMEFVYGRIGDRHGWVAVDNLK